MIDQEQPFNATNWGTIGATVHDGIVGQATWQEKYFGKLRLRMVQYTPGYKADHWCSKGHILLVLDGELNTELSDGRVLTLNTGDSYEVSDDMEPHRSSTQTGARLFIID